MAEEIEKNMGFNSTQELKNIASHEQYRNGIELTATPFGTVVTVKVSANFESHSLNEERENALDKIGHVFDRMTRISPGLSQEASLTMEVCKKMSDAEVKKFASEITVTFNKVVESLMDFGRVVDSATEGNLEKNEGYYEKILLDLYEDGTLSRLNMTSPEAKGKDLLFAFQDRKIVFANFKGGVLPFYCSYSGTGGKKAGSWQPFFGFTPDGKWFIKGGLEGGSAEKQIEDMANGFGYAEIQEVLKKLNEKFGDLRKNSDLAEEINEQSQSYFIRKVNSLIGHTLPKNSEQRNPLPRMNEIIDALDLTPASQEESSSRKIDDETLERFLRAFENGFEDDDDSFEIGSSVGIIRSNKVHEKDWVIYDVSEDGETITVRSADGVLSKDISKNSLLAFMELIPGKIEWGGAKIGDNVVFKAKNGEFDRGLVVERFGCDEGEMEVEVKIDEQHSSIIAIKKEDMIVYVLD